MSNIFVGVKFNKGSLCKFFADKKMPNNFLDSAIANGVGLKGSAAGWGSIMGKMVFIAVCFFIFMLRCENKQYFEITTTGEVYVFNEPEDGVYFHDEARKKKYIAMLKEGITLRVLDSYQGKDFLAYRVKMKNGLKGFVIHGDNFNVVAMNF